MRKSRKKLVYNRPYLSAFAKNHRRRYPDHKVGGASFLTAISLIIGSIILFFPLRNFYLTNYHDSSTDGSEAMETQNNTIPEDVKQAIQLENLSLKNTPQEVLSVATYRVPILLYHYVEYVQDRGDTIRISLNTPPYTLEEQIKTLIKAKYTFMTNSELTEALNNKSKLPSRPILLTFDDGYGDFYTDVLPILKKYNVRATAYLITGFLNRQNHLSDSQVQEVIDSKLVEIGAHTMHHAWLKEVNPKYAYDEISQSKTGLEKKFHIQVVSFAYPFGAFDNKAIELVKSSGFKSAVSTIPGVDQSGQNKFFLYRLKPGGRTGDDLLYWLNQEKF